MRDRDMDLVKRVEQFGYYVEMYETYPGWLIKYKSKVSEGEIECITPREAREEYGRKCSDCYRENTGKTNVD